MDRATALRIAAELLPEKSQRAHLDILFEHTLYPAYADFDDPEAQLRKELQAYKQKIEERNAAAATV